MAEYIVDTTDGILHARTTGELVRCRDCKHCLTDGEGRYLTDGEGRYVCMSLRYTTTPDGYCAWGERKESE